MHKVELHQAGRRAGPLLARGALAAFLAFGGFSSLLSVANAKTLDGASESGTTNVIVAHSGDGVRMRTAADGDVLDIFPDGTVVGLRGGLADTVVDSSGTRWWPVVVYGENGWIAGQYLDDDPDCGQRVVFLVSYIGGFHRRRLRQGRPRRGSN